MKQICHLIYVVIVNVNEHTVEKVIYFKVAYRPTGPGALYFICQVTLINKFLI